MENIITLSKEESPKTAAKAGQFYLHTGNGNVYQIVKEAYRDSFSLLLIRTGETFNNKSSSPENALSPAGNYRLITNPFTVTPGK